jgi:transposase, IS5 family
MSLRKRNLQPILGHSLDDLVDPDHEYRRILAVVPFGDLCAPLKEMYSDLGRPGYPVTSMFIALLIQFMEDLSYRELERNLNENLASKLFCGYQLTDQTPDYSTLCDFSLRVGPQRLSVLFRNVREALKSAGLVREVFTFIDSTHIIAKSNLWREKDLLLEAGKGKLGNLNVSSVAADPDARFGRKGQTKWYGYKNHVGIDMTYGFVTRTAITAANVEDTKAARHVMPKEGMVFGDKAYGVGESAYEMRRRGLNSGAILKQGMLAKNQDKDNWLCAVRMPFEGYFSKIERRARYRGTARNQFQAMMEGLVHNIKLLVRIGAPPLIFGPEYA